MCAPAIAVLFALLQARLEGVVVNERGEPVARAVVSTTDGSATTDERGSFTLVFPLAATDTVVVAVLPRGGSAQLFEESLMPGEVRKVRYALTASPALSGTVSETRLLPSVPKPDKSPQLGKYVLDRADLDRSPGSMEDVTRAITTLPGVVSDPDLLATFTVRGGASDETIDYLDGVPLSNPFHLGGFASIYNPMLIKSAQFFAGATPPQYDASLSGALDVAYATGETKKLHVEADVSMQTAKAVAQIPVTDGLSLTIALRRSYFELYFAGLRAAGVINSDYVAPEIGEYFGRAYWVTGAHHLTLTYARASDGFSFLLKPGEKPLFGTTTGLNLSNILQLAALTDRVAVGNGELKLMGAFTRDQSSTSIASATLAARNVVQLNALARADLTYPIGAGSLAGGVEFSHRQYDFRGQVSDDRGIAPWASFPLVETGQGVVPVTSNAPSEVPAVYASFLAKPLTALSAEAGARLEFPSLSRSLVYSLRTALAYDLPTHGILKAEAGLATQLPANVLLLLPGYGNPDLLPERSRQLVLALEQPLPIQALVRLEAFAKWYDRLAVNPDAQANVPTDGSAFQSLGTGTAKGVDLLVAGRTQRFSYGLAAGLLFADRTNPLASGSTTYPVAWDQRLTTSANVSYVPADRWLLSLRASFHTGRPYTPVVGFTRDEANQRFLPVFGATDSLRYPNFFETSARVEHRFTWGPISMTWYGELLNFTNQTNLFVETYDEGDFANNVPPAQGSFNHLPIRPFLGIRGEY
jgi:hypothetical protein